MKCFMCNDGIANQNAENKNLRICCTKCANDILKDNYKTLSKSKLKIQESHNNIEKCLQNVFQTLKALKKKSPSSLNQPTSIPEDLFTPTSIPLSTQTSTPILSPPISMLKPTPVHKSLLSFKGEVRILSQTETEKNNDLKCSFCKLIIVRKHYLYPLVILNCRHYYHQECFAKLMAQGKHRCTECKKNFFQSSDDDDDEEDDGKYF